MPQAAPIGLSTQVTYTVQSTVALSDWEVDAYRGTLGTNANVLSSGGWLRSGCSTSMRDGVTYRPCEETHYIDPDDVDSGDTGHLRNGDATSWSTYGTAYKPNGSRDTDKLSATVRLKRASRIVRIDAGPEPVAKDAKITVTGTVQRANWTNDRFDNYGLPAVQLQFKASGSSSYKTVKTVTASSAGALKTTVTAAQDGTWRWYFGGNDITGASNSVGDLVDVR
ncbi:hypothetical protein ABZZ80_03370 [Streptomyces sp. NPDC006356]